MIKDWDMFLAWLCSDHYKLGFSKESYTRKINPLQAYRLKIVVLMTVLVCWTFYYPYSAFQPLKFFSNHGFYLTWVYFLVAVQDSWINCGIRVSKPSNYEPSPNLKYIKYTLFEVTFSIQFIIVTLYWKFIYAGHFSSSHMLKVLEIIKHSVPLLCLTIDLLFNDYRFAMRKYLVTATYIFVSLLFNCIYTLNVERVYKEMLTWQDQLTIFMVLYGYGLTFFIHCIARFIFVHFKKHHKYYKHYQIEVKEMEPLY